MKKYIPILAFWGAISILLVETIGQIRQLKNMILQEQVHLRDLKEEKETTGSSLAIHQQWFRTKDPATNQIPSDQLLIARERRNWLLAQQTKGKILSAIPGIQWQERGPNNIGGRSRVAWFDLNDAANGYKKVWAAGVGGGLWYTNNIEAANPVWNKINDLFDNIAVTSFVQNALKPNEMYFGTGEGWFNLDAITGLGIWKSVDGGQTWNRLTTTANFKFVQDLAIDGNGALYAAVRPEAAGDAFGLQRSTDGGNSWTQVLGNPVLGVSSRAGDLELAANGDLYASIGFASQGRIYRSKAGANVGTLGTWQDITPNPTSNELPLATGTDEYNRIELIVAPNNGSLIYALFEGNTSSNCDYIKQYNSETNTWSSRTLPTIFDQGANSNFARGQAWYDLIGLVDPTNANSLWVGGIDGLRSDDGGVNWNQKTTWSLADAGDLTTSQLVHADHHAYNFSPGSNNRMVLTTDGAVYYSGNASAPKPTFTSKANSYNVTQLYGVALHPSNANYFLAGSQDNGTLLFKNPGMNNAEDVTGGDGGFSFIDQNEPNIQIASYVNNNYLISTDGGLSFINRDKNEEGDFINGFDYDDVSNIIYAPNSAGTYLRYNNPEIDGTTASVTLSGLSNVSLSIVKVSPITASRIYFGTHNGKVYRVDNAHTGTTKTPVLVFDQGIVGSISSIDIDVSNENHLLVSYSNFGVNSIWETRDGGSTWVSVEGNLPNMPVYWAMFDPRNSQWALLATDMGVWSTNNLNGSNSDWAPTNGGLANVRVDQLRYNRNTKVLAAATHGRGLFTTSLQPLASTKPQVNFSLGRVAFSEATSNTSGCRAYKDYQITLTISSAPASDVSITILHTDGDALAGVDYDISTNGNFTNPSNQLVFSAGSTADKSIMVRIYDDLDIEPVKAFTIGYTLLGSVAERGVEYQTTSVEIKSNDFQPSLPGLLNGVLGQTDIGFSIPFAAAATDAKTQMLYTAAELRAVGLSGGVISQIGFELTAKNTTGEYQNLSIKMGHSQLSSLRNQSFQPGLTVVYNKASYKTTQGANYFLLSTPFVWNGVDNVIVEMCYDNGSTNPAGGTAGVNDFTAATNTGSFVDDNVPILCTWMAALNSSCASIQSNISMSQHLENIGRRPVLLISAETKGTIISVGTGAASVPFGPNADIFVVNSNNELMMRLRNLSTHNYGCTEIGVDRSGVGAKPFKNNLAANYVADKTFYVQPTNNNSSGSYEISLYYTAAEIGGYQAATGQTLTQIQMAKTKQKVSSYSPGTIADADFQAVNATVSNFGTNRIIKASFNTGFSGFAVGTFSDAPLPFSFSSENAVATNNDIQVSWATTGEVPGTVYQVEHSLEANSGFTSVGTVNGTASSTQAANNYSFLHKSQATGTHYYRIRRSGGGVAEVLSRVVNATVLPIFAAGEIFIYPSPSPGPITLALGGSTANTAHWVIYNSVGQLVLQSGTLSGFSQAKITTQGLPNGIYVLVLEADGKKYTHRFVKI